MVKLKETFITASNNGELFLRICDIYPESFHILQYLNGDRNFFFNAC